MTTKPWYSRLYKYLAAFGEETPALIVATPLVHGDAPVKPLTIVLPIKQVVGGDVVTLRVKRAAAKPKAKAKRKKAVSRVRW